MKLKKVILPLNAIIIVVITSLLTYKVFSSAKPIISTSVEDNSSLTLNLPDQKYTIMYRELSNLGDKLIIPTRDHSSQEIFYDQQDGVVMAVTPARDYLVDLNNLRTQLSLYEFSKDLSFTPTYIIQDRQKEDFAEYNSRLNKIYRSPMVINLKNGSSFSELELDSTILRSILNPTSVSSNIPPEVDRTKLISYITSHLTPKQKPYFNPVTAYQNTRLAVHSRFMDENTPQVLGVDDGPSSSGELADRYLEVDLSQQKMYFFISGKLYKEYQISSGGEYPTPVGEFHILNKAPNAFSSIYNAWMPYWMGFKYAGDVGAYLGLHEIAYAVNEKGKRIYQSGNYIGEMMTGGCVAMSPTDSREIYNLSDVGMLVRIVK
ncbi:L,D-transpeptidase [Candidatus Woesebacteria bacterium]|nr:L,D-transpeptidase [Candidatus Woesebacteria bacterium]